MKKITILLFVLSSHFYFAQTSHKLDSLNLLLKKQKNDTAIVWLQNLIAEEYFNFKQDTAFRLWSNIDHKISKIIVSKKGVEKKSYLRTLAEVRNSIGAYYYGVGKIDSVIKYMNQSLKIRYETNDQYGIALSLNNIGFLYYYNGNIKQAIENWQQAEVIAEKINNILQLTTSLSNLGGIYNDVKEYEKAEKTYLKLINIRLKSNELQGLESAYTNLGTIYSIKKDTKNAFKYLKLGYDISTRDNIIETMVQGEYAFGILYNDLNKTDSAFYFYKKAYERAKKNSIKNYLVFLDEPLANYYIKENNYDKAMEYALEGYALALEQQKISQLSTFIHLQSIIYDKKGNIPLAYNLYKRYITLNDSIQKLSNEKEILKKQLDFDHEREKIAIQKEQEKKEAIAHEEKQKQQIILYSVLIFLILAILLIAIVYRSYKIKQKAHQDVSEKNRLIEFQKSLVEEKQKEILDSIHYAKRIQTALLTSKEFLDASFPNHFILFKPKDIVSGDFYWATEKNNKIFLAICDSTGHGVPGAFMSLLNIGFLSEAINEKNILIPGEVFDYVRKRLIESISSEGQKDGFDGILLCIDKNTNLVSYAAANNQPVLVSNETITYSGCDKMPVGKGEHNAAFTTFNLSYQPGDLVYLYTDGYADQFGGPKGKKFKYKQLNDLILSVSNISMPEQSIKLQSNFDRWRGDLEQVDDVLLVGIKL